MGSMHLALEGIDPDGSALAAFYRARAEGGAALIVTGGSAVSRVGAGGRNYSFIGEDADAPKLERVASAVHDAGARVLVQLFHAGRYALERSFGLTPVAPSPVYSSYSRCEPRALTDEEILETIEDFARGAARARELGFDGVEIMGSEGYLPSQFMAPLTNLRDDDWGGDAERRMRFPLAVAAAVRQASGPEQAVVYRVSGADLIPGGASADDVLALARRLASDSVDALNVGIGWHEARVPTVQATVPKAAWTPWARWIREAVEVPVIASNRINTVELAAAVIEAGDADFASLARPFLADPEIVAKSRSGRAPVNVCIACNQCIDNSIFDRRVSCVVNPRAGFELDVSSPGGARQLRPPAAMVAVVGGGPAGLEAARSLAMAGYAVELFEAAERLGGQFRMACRIPGKEDFARTIEYFDHELAALGVSVSLGARLADAEALAGFDAVVVATGVRPRQPDLSGVELPHVRSYASLLLDEAGGGVDLDGTVAIIGAGGIGVDVAHLLSASSGLRVTEFYARYGLTAGGVGAAALARKPRSAETSPEGPPLAATWPPKAPQRREVTLMRRSGRIGEGIGPSTRWVALQELEYDGVQLLTGVRYERIEHDAVTITTAEGELRRITAEMVVIAAGQEPETALSSALSDAGVPHVTIGGAAGAEGLDAGRAFREGFEAPAAVARAVAASG